MHLFGDRVADQLDGQSLQQQLALDASGRPLIELFEECVHLPVVGDQLLDQVGLVLHALPAFPMARRQPFPGTPRNAFALGSRLLPARIPRRRPVHPAATQRQGTVRSAAASAPQGGPPLQRRTPVSPRPPSDESRGTPAPGSEATHRTKGDGLPLDDDAAATRGTGTASPRTSCSTRRGLRRARSADVVRARCVQVGEGPRGPDGAAVTPPGIAVVGRSAAEIEAHPGGMLTPRDGGHRLVGELTEQTRGPARHDLVDPGAPWLPGCLGSGGVGPVTQSSRVEPPGPTRATTAASAAVG